MDTLKIEIVNKVGLIKLNRPDSLNALTYEMIRKIEQTLDHWVTESIDFIILEAAGERAFCAGGDIADLYESGLKKNYTYSQAFWLDEYRLNEKIANYPKPIISFLQGFTMGGGVGLGCHVSHRIVSESSKIAMPECGIGLIPDVGGSFILAKAPIGIGEYLATTGYRMDADDAVFSGFSDYFIPQSDWKEVKAKLIKSRSISVLDEFIKDPPMGELKSKLKEISSIFSNDSLCAIIDNLEKRNSTFSTQTLKLIEKNSPLSVLCTFEIIKILRKKENLTIKDSLEYEYRFTYRAIECSDFVEGIRAQVIDKDRNPNWQHNHIRNVPREKVKTMLKPLNYN